MEALIITRFCMTFLPLPMRTYIRRREDIFHRGPRNTYGNLLSLMAMVDLRVIDDGRAR